VAHIGGLKVEEVEEGRVVYGASAGLACRFPPKKKPGWVHHENTLDVLASIPSNGHQEKRDRDAHTAARGDWRLETS
jgi:hypothetical protein